MLLSVTAAGRGARRAPPRARQGPRRPAGPGIAVSSPRRPAQAGGGWGRARSPGQARWALRWGLVARPPPRARDRDCPPGPPGMRAAPGWAGAPHRHRPRHPGPAGGGKHRPRVAGSSAPGRPGPAQRAAAATAKTQTKFLAPHCTAAGPASWLRLWELALRPGTSSLQAAAKISEKLSKAWFSVLLKRILEENKTTTKKKQKTNGKTPSPALLRPSEHGPPRALPPRPGKRAGRGEAPRPGRRLLSCAARAPPRRARLRSAAGAGWASRARRLPRGSSPSCCSHSAASP